VAVAALPAQLRPLVQVSVREAAPAVPASEFLHGVQIVAPMFSETFGTPQTGLELKCAGTPDMTAFAFKLECLQDPTYRN